MAQHQTRDEALQEEGWDLVLTASTARLYQRSGIVTVGATHVVQVADEPTDRVVTLIGRGSTIEEAVAALGTHGLF